MAATNRNPSQQSAAGSEWYRRYVDVVVTFRKDGRVFPVEIIWDDGRRYKIDRITDVSSRPALHAGGQGDCYTVLIAQKDYYAERKLYFERSAELTGRTLGRWFVEALRES